MHLELVPMLQLQRDLHDLPRGPERFQRYLEAMVGGTDDIAFPPMVAMNPMGREHVVAVYDRLLALGAEAVAANALAEAEERLAGVPGAFKLGLVVADDVKGGWTNRYCSEASLRFAPEAALKRGWIAGAFWSSEEPSAERVRETVLMAVFRTAYVQRHGGPRTLREHLTQEGLAAAFAGAEEPRLEPEEQDYAAEVLAPHLESAHYPTVFACLFGDEAAASIGYPALGLPPRAGFAWALAAARGRGQPLDPALLSLKPRDLPSLGRTGARESRT